MATYYPQQGPNQPVTGPAQPQVPAYSPPVPGAAGGDPNPQWVVLPDGRVVDANSSQYGGPGWGATTGPGAAPAGAPPAAGAPAGGAPTLNVNDPNSVDAYIKYMASQPGADPSLTNDPNYWKNLVLSGQLGTDPGYIAGKMMNAWKGGSGGGSAYGSGGPFTPLPGFTFNPYNYSGYSAPGYNAPAQGQAATPFQYSPLQTPSLYQTPTISSAPTFSFPGVQQTAAPSGPVPGTFPQWAQQNYQPTQQFGWAPPPTPAQAAPPAPGAAPAVAPPPQPPTDPTAGAPFPNAIMVNGGWRDQGDQSPEVQAAVQQWQQAQAQYQTALTAYQAQQSAGTGGTPAPVGTNGGGNAPGSATVSSFSVLQQMNPQVAQLLQQENPNATPDQLDQLTRSFGTLGGVAQAVGAPQLVTAQPQAGVAGPQGVATGDGGNAWYYAPGGPGGPPATPGGQVGSSNPWEGVLPQMQGGAPQGGSPYGQMGVMTSGGGDAWYYAPGGPGGPPLQPGQQPTPPPQGVAQSGQLPQPQPGTAPGQPPLAPGQLYAAGNTMPLYQGVQIPNAPGPYQTSAPFQYGQPASSFTAPNTLATPQTFTNPNTLNLPSPYSPQGQFAYASMPTIAPLANPQTVNPADFPGVTSDQLYQDPSYKFRLQQGLDSLQASAANSGMLFSGATGKAITDYAGESASQEYQNVWNRDYQQWAQQQANALAAAGYNTQAQQAQYQINANTQLGQQQQGYAQAANTYGLNEQTSLNAYNTNLSALLQGQGQQFNQAASAYGLNQQTQQAAQQQQYVQAANTYGLDQSSQQQGYTQAAQTAAYNEAMAQAGYNINATVPLQYAQAQQAANLGTYQTNAQTQLAAQQQAYTEAQQQAQMNFQNQFNVQQANAALGQQGYQINANTQLGYNNQAYNQAYNSWAGNASNALNWYQTNAQTQLAAYEANAQAQQAAAGLNLQGSLGAWSANNDLAFQAYQSQVQQALAQAGYGLQAQQLGLAANQQAFNQGITTYDTNYQTQVVDPFNRATTAATVGNPNSLLSLFGNNTQSLSQLLQGIGNTNAGSIIGQQNATNAGITGAANAFQQGAYGYFYGPQPKSSTTTPQYPPYPGYTSGATGAGSPYGPYNPFVPPSGTGGAYG